MNSLLVRIAMLLVRFVQFNLAADLLAVAVAEFVCVLAGKDSR